MWDSADIYNISVIAENSLGRPCPKCPTWQEKITFMYFGITVLSPISAVPLV